MRAIDRLTYFFSQRYSKTSLAFCTPEIGRTKKTCWCPVCPQQSKQKNKKRVHSTNRLAFVSIAKVSSSRDRHNYRDSADIDNNRQHTKVHYSRNTLSPRATVFRSSRCKGCRSTNHKAEACIAIAPLRRPILFVRKGTTGWSSPKPLIQSASRTSSRRSNLLSSRKLHVMLISQSSGTLTDSSSHPFVFGKIIL